MNAKTLGLGVLSTTALFAASSPARAGFPGDLVPRLVGNTILTDGLSDIDGSTATDVSVFQWTLGALAPGYTMDPGFQPLSPNNGTNLPASNLPGDSYIGFNVTTSLMYWNGTGTPAFSPVTDATQLELYLGGAHLYITGTTGATDGFVIQKLTSAGSGHRHLNAQFLGAPNPNGAYLDNLGNAYDAPTDGIYALGITVTDAASLTTDPNNYHSLTKWLVYNNNRSASALSAGAAILGLPGDATLDGHVDLSDLSIVLNHFGQSTNAWTDGNFDAQPTIDLTDLSDVLNNFGTSIPISTTASPAISTPEPASLALLLPFVWSSAFTRRHPRMRSTTH
ncbi:MAG TPA: hypothetical protein VM008_07415 [Phycisphaerae bacterium]|nr:hypothetical protein [Phycisphaerae bacterium]